jgi:5-methylcytosine-specific restriction endonuclease McrA
MATSFVPYYEYLQSEQWRAKHLAALERAGHRCQVCAATEPLTVHHNSYANLGKEPAVDVVVLCRPCHDRFHNGCCRRKDEH